MFVAGLWKSLILKARKSLAHWKQGFMGHSGGWKTTTQENMEAGLMEISKYNKDPSTGFGLKVICVIILAKNLTSFCLYPENLSRTEFKDNGLV